MAGAGLTSPAAQQQAQEQALPQQDKQQAAVAGKTQAIEQPQQQQQAAKGGEGGGAGSHRDLLGSGSSGAAKERWVTSRQCLQGIGALSFRRRMRYAG